MRLFSVSYLVAEMYKLGRNVPEEINFTDTERPVRELGLGTCDDSWFSQIHNQTSLCLLPPQRRKRLFDKAALKVSISRYNALVATNGFHSQVLNLLAFICIM